MTGKTGKFPSLPAAGKSSVLEELSPSQGLEILKRLANEDANISKRANVLAREYLSEIDPDVIADEVFLSLNGIEVEDVWQNSGSTRYGYIDPYELASDMFEEALEPYLEEMRKCHKLSLYREAKLHCMGILEGIYRFEVEATSEFQDWVTDVPQNNFEQVLEEWQKRNRDPSLLDEMDMFVKSNFERWKR